MSSPRRPSEDEADAADRDKQQASDQVADLRHARQPWHRDAQAAMADGLFSFGQGVGWYVHRRAAFRGRAQDGLADGGTSWPGSALSHAITAGAQFVERGEAARPRTCGGDRIAG